MSDIFCSMRSTECGCDIHHCAAARPKTEAAPTHSFSARDHLSVIACGLFVFGIIWLAMTKADDFYREQAIDCQEACVSWRK